MSLFKAKNTLWIFIILIAGIVIHTATFINTEQHIYFWDYNGYWRIWENFSELLVSKPGEFFTALYGSIYNEDYNALPVALITPFYYLGLPSRLTYILSLQILYFVPVVYLFYKCTQCVIEEKTPLFKWWVLIVTASFVAFWSPTLKGYPDISGLIGILLATLLVLKTPLTEGVFWKRALLTGIFLWSAFLFRRWYAFTIVTLYLTLPVLNFLIYSKKGERVKNARNIILNFFLSGVLSVILAVLFQKNLIVRVLTTDYSVIYSAYQSQLSTSIYNTAYGIGLYLFPIFIVGLIFSVFEKDKKAKIFVAFCLVNLLLSFYLFTRTQAPGVQHCLPFSMWFLFVSIYGIYKILTAIKHSAVKTLLIVLICALSLLVNIISTVPAFKSYTKLAEIFPTRAYPLHIDNYKNYVLFIQKLESLTKNSKDKITVYSSSGVLNDDMIKTMAHRGLDNSIEYTSQVDLRDGIRLEALESRYVVVVTPVQTHILASGQQVITIPANSLLKHENIGNAYTQIGNGFTLSKGATAYIYEKNRNFTPDEYFDFISLFSKSYPDWLDKYTTGLNSAWITALVTKGDIWGEFNLNDNGTISAHPGENSPTVVNWYLRKVASLKISSISTSCPNADGIDVTIENNEGKTEKVHIPSGGTEILDTHDFNGMKSTLTVDKHQNAGCDSILIQQQ